MKNKYIIPGIVLVLIIAVVAGLIILSRSQNNTPVEQHEEMMQPVSHPTDDSTMMHDPVSGAMNDTTNKTDDSMMHEDSMKTGLYIPFDKAKISNAKSGKVIVFFYASWCPTCNGLNKDINSNLSSIPSDTTILKIPYDDISGATSDELAYKSKYGVTYQHTLVQVDENGDLIKKWVGSPTLSDLISEIV